MSPRRSNARKTQTEKEAGLLQRLTIQRESMVGNAGAVRPSISDYMGDLEFQDQVLSMGRERIWSAVTNRTSKAIFAMEPLRGVDFSPHAAALAASEPFRETDHSAPLAANSHEQLLEEDPIDRLVDRMSKVDTEYETVVDLLFFLEQPELCRASKLTLVMDNWASILRSNEGSASTYELSSPVERISAFISHNWAKWWFQKFISLSVHFHFLSTMLAYAAIVAVIVAVFLLLDIAYESTEVLVLKFFSVPLFVWLLFTHKVRARVQQRRGILRDPDVFLDKTCIIQECHVLQQQGIRKLGAFLNMSNTMVVLYSDMYLERLWTVYEMATWVLLKDLDDMIIIPQFLPWVVLAGIIVPYVTEGFISTLAFFDMHTMRMVGLETTLYRQMIGSFIASQVLMYVARRFAHKQVNIYRKMSKFEFNESKCFAEADRAVVKESIANILRALGTLPPDCEEEECMQVFNTIVRTRLPRVVTRSLGRNLGLQYWHMIAFSLIPRLVDLLMDSIPKVIRSRTIQGEVCNPDRTNDDCVDGELAFFYVLWVIVIEPIRFSLMMRWCTSCLRMKGCAALIFVESFWVLYFGLAIIGFILLGRVRWYNLFFVTFPILLAINLLVYRCVCCTRRKERLPKVSQPIRQSIKKSFASASYRRDSTLTVRSRVSSMPQVSSLMQHHRSTPARSPIAAPVTFSLGSRPSGKTSQPVVATKTNEGRDVVRFGFDVDAPRPTLTLPADPDASRPTLPVDPDAPRSSVPTNVGGRPRGSTSMRPVELSNVTLV